MRKHPGLCQKLLQRILPDLEIDHIEVVETQKSIDEDIDARSVRLDAYVRDDLERVYSIEMQRWRTQKSCQREAGTIQR